MPQAFIVTAIAQSCDLHRAISSSQRIYADHLEWRSSLSRCAWFATREEAVMRVIAGGDGDDPSSIFLGRDPIRATAIEILELRYDTVVTYITDDERDAVVRKRALARLTNEERRVLGLDNL